MKNTCFPSLVAVMLSACLFGCQGDSGGSSHSGPPIDEEFKLQVALSVSLWAPEPRSLSVQAPAVRADTRGVAFIGRFDYDDPCSDGGSMKGYYDFHDYPSHPDGWVGDIYTEFTDCLIGNMLQNGVMSEMYLDPAEGFEVTYRFTTDSYKQRIQSGSNYFESQSDGGYVSSSRLNEAVIDTDVIIEELAFCDGDTWTSKRHEKGTLHQTFYSDRLEVSFNGLIEQEDDSIFSGKFTVSSVSPYLFSMNAPTSSKITMPYAGEVIMTREDGLQIEIEIVQGGVFVNNSFITHSELESAVNDGALKTSIPFRLCVY